MLALAVLLVAQGPVVWAARPDSATVGDTIFLSRALPAAAGVRARPQPLPRTPGMEPLADPVLDQRGNVLTLRYAVALFEPGRQRIAMPPIELLYPDGNLETVVGDTAVVWVRSVLPRGDSLPAAKPSLAPLPRSRRRAAPAALLVSVILVGTGTWALVRRRAGPRPRLELPIPASDDVPLAAWVEAGELRAAATVVAEQLRQALARREPDAGPGLTTDALLEVLRARRPEWPLSEVEDTLHALERARFAPAVPSDVLALREQVAMLTERIVEES